MVLASQLTCLALIGMFWYMGSHGWFVAHIVKEYEGHLGNFNLSVWSTQLDFLNSYLD